MKRACVWWLAAAGLVAVLWALSSMPARNLGAGWMWQYDKLIHGSVYALLGALIAGGGVARGWRPRWSAALAIAVTAAYGLIDEWHQSFTPGRDASVGDLLADATGGTIGALAIATLMYRPRRP